MADSRAMTATPANRSRICSSDCLGNGTKTRYREKWMTSQFTTTKVCRKAKIWRSGINRYLKLDSSSRSGTTFTKAM